MHQAIPPDQDNTSTKEDIEDQKCTGSHVSTAGAVSLAESGMAIRIEKVMEVNLTCLEMRE